jgi:SAM-dependent methyltransferase
MDGAHWRPTTYGDAFADIYDAWYSDVSDVDATVAAVVALAGDGPGRVLELGVGTGRLALPLARAGLDVTGLDASSLMLARLADNDVHGQVAAVAGDMAGPLPSGPFDVVLAAYNTFFNLTSEGGQRRCLQAVADVLADGGSLLVEAFVPAMGGESVRHVEPRLLGPDEVVLDASISDAAEQTVRGQQIHIEASGRITLRPWAIRYLSTDQLDAMAGAAGLRLVERWADWDRSPMTGDAPSHVSRYGR